jgi:hypothetical protein
MKQILVIIALLACGAKAPAQGTLQFSATLTGANEVPPNNDPTVGAGTFTLNGNVLNFYVEVPLVTFIPDKAYIQGPALPGSTGPIIFDLGGPGISPGSDYLGTPPVYHFFSPFGGIFGAGPFTLTDAQINDLESGLWYVNATSEEVPGVGILRGQIVEVPEPSTWALLCGAGTAFWWWRRKPCGKGL